MITLASWNPASPNKPYHHELAGGSHLIIIEVWIMSETQEQH